MSGSNLVYILDNKIYINLTNNCTNDCVFCIRAVKDDVLGTDLRLKDENIKAEDVMAQLDLIKKSGLSSEIVFCGYGEPMLKLGVLKNTARQIKKKYPNAIIRVNTNGHANLVYKRNVLPELKGLADKFSISLNGENEKVYNELSNPKLKDAYEAVKDFIKEAAKEGFDTTASIVTGYKDYKVDKNKCSEIAKSLGAKFREREWIEKGY